MNLNGGNPLKQSDVNAVHNIYKFIDHIYTILFFLLVNSEYGKNYFLEQEYMGTIIAIVVTVITFLVLVNLVVENKNLYAPNIKNRRLLSIHASKAVYILLFGMVFIALLLYAFKIGKVSPFAVLVQPHVIFYFFVIDKMIDLVDMAIFEKAAYVVNITISTYLAWLFAFKSFPIFGINVLILIPIAFFYIFQFLFVKRPLYKPQTTV